MTMTRKPNKTRDQHAASAHPQDHVTRKSATPAQGPLAHRRGAGKAESGSKSAPGRAGRHPHPQHRHHPVTPGSTVGSRSPGGGLPLLPPATPTHTGSHRGHTGAARLDRRDREELRALLQAKRAELIGDVSDLVSDTRRPANGKPATGDLLDVGGDAWEKEFTFALIESRQTLLQDIDNALARMDRGEYGLCELDRQPISKARLRAMPWARLCIQCARQRERGILTPAQRRQVEDDPADE